VILLNKYMLQPPSSAARTPPRAKYEINLTTRDMSLRGMALRAMTKQSPVFEGRELFSIAESQS